MSTTIPNSSPAPRISIVTPSYNQCQFVESTIQSVLAQGYPNLEYIVLDGGSSDGSVDTIKKYKHLLTYWRSGPDDGQYAAINEGFARSTGDILAWLNSDDVYLPGCLNFVASAFIAYPEMKWLTSISPGGLNCFGDLTAGRLSGVSCESFLAGRHLIGYAKNAIGFIQQESTFFRRDLWDTGGGLDLKFNLAADFALWSSFFRTAEIYVTPTMLGAFRGHTTNRSAIRFSKYFSEAAHVLRSHREEVSWKPNSLRESIANAGGRRFGRIANLIGYSTTCVHRSKVGPEIVWQKSALNFL